MFMEWVERFERKKGNNMSKADKMFEELGYEKKEYGSSKIMYAKDLDFEGYCIKSVWFDKVKKLVRLYGYYDIQELQAINEKCKELEWL